MENQSAQPPSSSEPRSGSPTVYGKGQKLWYVPENGDGAYFTAIIEEGPHGRVSPYYCVDVPDCDWTVATADEYELFTDEMAAKIAAAKVEAEHLRYELYKLEKARQPLAARLEAVTAFQSENIGGETRA